MKPSLKLFIVGAFTLLAALAACQKSSSTAERKGFGDAGEPFGEPREADAAELALVAPLVKGGNLLNYKVTAIMQVPRQGLLVSLTKDGPAFLPDGGESDGGSCDPNQVEQARLLLVLRPYSDAGPPHGLVRGQYVISALPQSVPQVEADRLADAFGEVIAAKPEGPVPPRLAN